MKIFNRKHGLKCKACKKQIVNRRNCLYVKYDYEAENEFTNPVIHVLCSVKCSLKFQGVPRNKEG